VAAAAPGCNGSTTPGPAPPPVYASSMRRVRLVIKGEVQGVSYRASAAHEGRRLGLTGWVKNQSDGSVLLEAQGAPDRVEQLVEWARRGPPAAEVKDVDVTELQLEIKEQGFVIRY
jgi:acylphosphatase